MLTACQVHDRSSGPHAVSHPSYFMAPTSEPPVSPAARRTMQANRGHDTGPELAIRAILHRAGLRYRVNVPLPFNRRRRADIVLSRAGLFVFIDGCFWHGCPEHFVTPKTRTQFWVDKVEGNRARDRDTDEHLMQMGFTPIRIWEHVEPVRASEIVLDAYLASITKTRPRKLQ